jgi:hypothetical protein
LVAKASTIKLGKTVIIIGLFLQIVFFGLFLICGGVFHFRLLRSPTPSSTQVNWAKYMYTLYAAGILILIRSIFRVAEFTGGNDGPIMTHEFFLYLFDGVLMFGVMTLFNAVHPGAIIGRKGGSQGIIMNERQDISNEGVTYERK